MSIGALDAQAAYNRSLGVVVAPASAKPADAAAAVPAAGSFGGMVDLATDAAGALRAAEEASAKHLAGKGDLIDVVTAISAAEHALETVVAVRDRVINAYTDIMRMQI